MCDEKKPNDSRVRVRKALSSYPPFLKQSYNLPKDPRKPDDFRVRVKTGYRFLHFRYVLDLDFKKPSDHVKTYSVGKQLNTQHENYILIF